MPSLRSCLVVLAFTWPAAPSLEARAAKCPNVMLVLDRSGSMADPPDANGKDTKWGLLQKAVHKVIGQYGDRVPFGLEMYTFSALGFPDDITCYAQTRIDVEPAHGTAGAILKLIDNSMPDGGTNTGEAIKRANADAALRDSTRSNFIILITDGDPNCNSGDSCISCAAGFTIKQIQAAAANNIHTFVVGFDGTTASAPPTSTPWPRPASSRRTRATAAPGSSPATTAPPTRSRSARPSTRSSTRWCRARVRQHDPVRRLLRQQRLPRRPDLRHQRQ